MDKNEELLELIKKLELGKKSVKAVISGYIKEIEEIEQNHYKLKIQIDTKIYDGIYIKINDIEDYNNLKLMNQIVFNSIKLSHKDRNIYISSKNYEINENFINEKYLNKKEKEEYLYDLSPKSFIKTLMTFSENNYQSDIFIYKKNNDLYTLIPIKENNIFILDNPVSEEFISFISKNKVNNNMLILIDNYIFDKDKNIKFNNMTLFNLVNLENLDEYTKENLFKDNNSLNINNKDKIIFYYKLNSNNNIKYLFIKIIDIQTECILGIDYLYNIYKIYKKSNKLIETIDVFKIIFIKNFILKEENSFYIISLNESSYISIFENTFKKILLNDITVINFHYIDYIEPSNKNYFNEIGVDKAFTFQILNKCEYVIVFRKNYINYNYYPISIKLISNDKRESHIYNFFLYAGLLNNVNCLINYKDINKYGYEYFYYNFSFDLPKFIEIYVENIRYKIEYSDYFNSRARKRFIILNYYDKSYQEIIDSQKSFTKKDNNIQIQIKKTKINNTIDNNKNKIEDDKDINKDMNKDVNNNINIDIINKENDQDNYIEDENDIDFNLNIETTHDCTQLCFLYENDKKNIFGIHDVEEISNIFKIEKKISFNPKNEYKIFYEYFKLLMNDKLQISTKNINLYFESLNKVKYDDNIQEIFINNNIDFTEINYENYLIYINLCLFHYLNKTKSKKELINEFIEKFNDLEQSELPFYDRIRIIRFICQEYIKIVSENRNFNLLLMDKLDETNSYKIASNYNKNIINNLNENSELFIAFLQLDGYIMFNYLCNSETYTLSLEPLIMTKTHLLSSYDNFIFTVKEKPTKNTVVYAYQNTNNDITIINEYGLFPSNNNMDGKLIKGNDFAVPISTELLHERNGHSKKDKKNKRKQSPLYFYTRNGLIKADKDYREINEDKKLDKGEAGLLVEYFINYKNINLSQELKKNLKLGNIIQNVKYFTSENFYDLYVEINKFKNIDNLNLDDKTLKIGHSNKEKIKDKIQLKSKDNNEIFKDNEKDESKEGIDFYEKNYLSAQKYFIYPDSIPITYYYYDAEKKSFLPKNSLPNGKIEFLNKYKECIKEGRLIHYGSK